MYMGLANLKAGLAWLSLQQVDQGAVSGIGTSLVSDRREVKRNSS